MTLPTKLAPLDISNVTLRRKARRIEAKVADVVEFERKEFGMSWRA